MYDANHAKTGFPAFSYELEEGTSGIFKNEPMKIQFSLYAKVTATKFSELLILNAAAFETQNVSGLNFLGIIMIR